MKQERYPIPTKTFMLIHIWPKPLDLNWEFRNALEGIAKAKRKSQGRNNEARIAIIWSKHGNYERFPKNKAYLNTYKSGSLVTNSYPAIS